MTKPAQPYPAGRPTKGDRHAFMTRVPKPAAEAVMEAAERAGLSYSEYIAWVLANSHGFPTPLPTGSASAPEQGRLPLASVS